ncbi:hypothetical protein [Pedobacter cryophilus]|uniref:Apolipoprotein N-acyltransferase N-terminal domain-containing protein n=1 Tax=Pedobacter cryophilus TaxID=2571271 RepID=A0A4U1BVE2_9SPHI|nr:hypothetical protein [Pedobacter cryophilus]TKB96769.1 hypothetical protein FA046_11840 [Pedobacter cryophilus]
MKQRFLIYPAISAIAIVISIFFFLPWLALIAFVPLLLALENTNHKQTLATAGIFSSVLGSFILSWMLLSNIPSVDNLLYSFLGMLLSVTYFIIAITVVFLIWNRLTKSIFSCKSILILATLFTLFEFIYDQLFNTLPWYSFHFGNPLIGSIYTIQLAEIGGIYILTFSVLLINGFAAYGIKQHKQLGVASMVIGLFFTANFLLYNIRSVKATPNTEVKINILTPNIKQAVNTRNTIELMPTDLTNWTQALNHQENNYKIINSAYIVNPIETVSDINVNVYLKIIEEEEETQSEIKNQQPNHSFIVKPENKSNLTETNKDIDGIFIFNEAIIAPTAAQLVQAGAPFLVSINNDNWLKDAYITRLFFYYNSLRAVENRRDIAIKSNFGYTGKASSNGETHLINNQNTSVPTPITIIKNSETTLYSQYPFAFILFCKLLFVVVAFLILIKSGLKFKSLKKLKEQPVFEVFEN